MKKKISTGDLLVGRTIDVSIGVGFLNVSFPLSLDKLLQSFWGTFGKKSTLLSAELIQWCLKEILNDRLTEKEMVGAWGKKYVDYLCFIYGEGEIPNDIRMI